MILRLALALVCVACSQVSNAQLSGVVDAATVAKVSAQFKSILKDQGMLGVSAAIDKCYEAAGIKNAKASSECMLMDIAAYNLDSGMRKAYLARGAKVPPVTPQLADDSFRARMLIHTAFTFNRSWDAAMRYFGSAPDKIVEDVSR